MRIVYTQNQYALRNFVIKVPYKVYDAVGCSMLDVWLTLTSFP